MVRRDSRKRKWEGGGKGGGGRKGRKGGEGKGKGKGKGGAGHPDGQATKRRAPSGPLPKCAVVISSNTPSLIKKATQEAVRLLSDALGVLRPPAAERAADTNTGEPASAPVCSLLDEELKEMREAASKEAGAVKKPRIAFYGEVTRGIAAISCPSEADVEGFPAPSRLVQQVFAAHGDGESARGRVARFVVRMWPLDVVCSPHLKQFQAAAASSLPRLFASVPEGATWYLQFHSRAMGTLKRDEVLVAVKEILGPLKLEMSVCDAEYMVVVEVNPLLCGFAVLRGYAGPLHECNLQSLCSASGRGGAAADEEDEEDDDDEDSEGDEDAEEGAAEGAARPACDQAASGGQHQEAQEVAQVAEAAAEPPAPEPPGPGQGEAAAAAAPAAAPPGGAAPAAEAAAVGQEPPEAAAP